MSTARETIFNAEVERALLDGMDLAEAETKAAMLLQMYSITDEPSAVAHLDRYAAMYPTEHIALSPAHEKTASAVIVRLDEIRAARRNGKAPA